MAHKIEVAFEAIDHDGDTVTVSTDVSEEARKEGAILTVTAGGYQATYLDAEDAKALAAFLIAEAGE